MNAEKEELRNKIQVELKKMKVGFCGIKWDCIVWRISKDLWQVGHTTVSTKREGVNLEEAAHFISISDT